MKSLQRRSGCAAPIRRYHASMPIAVSPDRPRRRLPRISPFLTHLWRERLTRPGQSVIVGAAVSGIAIAYPDRMAGTLAFSFFAALTLVAVVTAMRKPRVAVQRLMPGRCMAGELATMTIRVRSASRRTLVDIGAYEYRLPRPLRLVEDPKYIDRLPPGESHNFEYRLYVPRRGHYFLPGPSALSTFPFALAQAKRFAPQPHRLVVYPRFQPLRRLRLGGGHRYQPGGVTMLSRVGESMEFVGNREYRFGDRVRDVHTRSWARVGYPVVRQYQQEFLTRVALLVDTFVPWRWRPIVRRGGQGLDLLLRTRFVWGYDQEMLEANLSLAAAVTDCLARDDCVVDLFAAGPQLYHFESGRSLAHHENILDILACIEGCRDADPLAVVAPSFHERLRQTSSVIALLMGWDRRRAEFIASIRALGVEVKTIVLTDDERQSADAVAAGATHVTVERVLAGVEEL